MAKEPKVANISPEAVRRVEAGGALPSFFELSTEDKSQPVPKLSVWVEGPTSVAQAWTLVGANPALCWVVRLEVDEVRRVFAPAAGTFPPTPTLDVVWDQATALDGAGVRVPETRPGHEGHAGITNLGEGNKTQRGAIRGQLADCADVEILRPEQLAAFAGEAGC